jgi:uncharacterized protein YbjT (DUF2867 family)
MNVLVFGATGMVGQGVLRECVQDPDVDNPAFERKSFLSEQFPHEQRAA